MSLSRRSLLLSVLGVVALNQLPAALAAPTAQPTPASQQQPYAGAFTVSYWFKQDNKPWQHITVVQNEDRSKIGYLDGAQAAENDFSGYVHFDAAFELGTALCRDRAHTQLPLERFYQRLSAHYRGSQAMFDDLKIVDIAVTADGIESTAASGEHHKHQSGFPFSG